MIPRLGVAFSVEGWPAASAEELRELGSDVLAFQGLQWHGRFLPDHFAQEAYAKYGYQKRTAAHMRKKSQKYKHQLPLVYSGSLRRETTGRAVVTKTRREAHVKFGGRSLNLAGIQKRKSSSYPDLWRELIAIRQEEIDLLAREGEKEMAKRLNDIRTRQTSRA